MTKWGFIGLVALPILEITLFVVIGGRIGILATLAIIVATFFLGIWVLKAQGRVKPRVTSRQGALSFLAHQLLLFLAAVCLILPGFFTDAIGLLLLIRPIRSLIIGLVTVSALAKFSDLAKRGGMTPADDILEGEFVDVTPSAPRNRQGIENQDH